MTKIITLCLGLTITALFIYATSCGLEKHEINECSKWQKEAGEYEDYYLTQWQASQCDHYKISINAPIR